MWRRSLSCMIAGAMIMVPLWLIAATDPDLRPSKTAIIAVLFVSVVGVAWLYDELY